MAIFDRISDSAGLVSGMADRLGFDFGDRIAASPDTAARGYLAMVLRCTGCTEHAACARLQAENPVLDAAPAYCRNRDVLHRQGNSRE